MIISRNIFSSLDSQEPSLPVMSKFLKLSLDSVRFEDGVGSLKMKVRFKGFWEAIYLVSSRHAG